MRLARAFSIVALLALALVGVVLTMGRLAPGALGDRQWPVVATPDVVVRSVPVSLPRAKARRSGRVRVATVPAVARTIPVATPAVVRRPAAPAPRPLQVAPQVPHRGHPRHNQAPAAQPAPPTPSLQTPAAPAQQSTPAPAPTTPATVQVQPATPAALPQDLPVPPLVVDAPPARQRDDCHHHGRMDD